MLQLRLKKAEFSGHRAILSPSILQAGSRLMMLIRKAKTCRGKMANSKSRHCTEEEALMAHRDFSITTGQGNANPDQKEISMQNNVVR